MKSTKKLLEEFDAAARHYGYIMDQGRGREVHRAEKEYHQTMARLTRRILHLEQKQKRGKNVSSKPKARRND